MNKVLKIVALVCALMNLLSVGCNHAHTFDQSVQSKEYLKSEATCKDKAQYYYSCSCGKAGEETFEVGSVGTHAYVAEVVAEEYLKSKANCQSPAIYYKSCESCGRKGYGTHVFSYGENGACDYSLEIPEERYLKLEATLESGEVYYKSCVCGEHGAETFIYGEALRDYTEEEKLDYVPTSLTVSFYDAENSVYGFTFNTSLKPLRPVIQIQKGSEWSNNYEEYLATVEKASSYDKSNKEISYFIAKAEIELEENQTYTYRVYDKYVDIGTPISTLQTKSVHSEEFKFAHISDTQNFPKYFGDVLNNVTGNVDFLLHSGDVVENSKYEEEWKEMLNGNFEYLSKVPMMAISGNHETTYLNGSNETYKHFNYKLPTQTSTQKGLFYSFVYGNAKFIMLNTNDLTSSKLKKEQYDWLINELKNNEMVWTIVVMHNPIYSAGGYGSNPEKNTIALALRSQLESIFANYGVDIVLQGHDHVVSRTCPIDAQGVAQTEEWNNLNGVDYSVNPNGVIYLMNGTSGGQTRAPFTTDTGVYQYALASNNRTWAEFNIDGTKMEIVVKYYNGSEVKEARRWGILKTNE